MNFQFSRPQFCTLILYDWKIGSTYKNTRAHLLQAWGDQIPSENTLANCFRQFQQNNLSVDDTVHLDRSRISINEQSIDVRRTIIENDPYSTYQQIEGILSISATAINSIIDDYLKRRKVCIQWIQHQSTAMTKTSAAFNFVITHSRNLKKIIPIVCLTLELVMNLVSSITIQKQKTRKKFRLSEADPRPSKVHRNKVPAK